MKFANSSLNLLIMLYVISLSYMRLMVKIADFDCQIISQQCLPFHLNLTTSKDYITIFACFQQMVITDTYDEKHVFGT